MIRRRRQRRRLFHRGKSASGGAGRIVYFQSGTETGDLTDWTGTNGSVAASTAVKRTGSYSVECHYAIASPTPAHQDSNVYVYKTISEAPTHWFARAYFYHQVPVGDGTTHPVQRKIFWFGADSGTTNWTCGLTTDSTATPSPGGMVLRFFVNGSSGCSVSADNASPQYDADAAFWDTWVCLETEVQLNTPGSSDGIVRVWVNGTKVTDDSVISIRGTCSSGLGYFSVGRQADRTAGNLVDEYRYIDDIVLASTYTGL